MQAVVTQWLIAQGTDSYQAGREELVSEYCTLILAVTMWKVIVLQCIKYELFLAQ